MQLVVLVNDKKAFVCYVSIVSPQFVYSPAVAAISLNNKYLPQIEN
jgi:hypothetical protein